MADVTSVNVVGFINLNLKPGYNLIANQLNAANASNHIAVVLPSVDQDTLLLKFDAVHQTWLSPDIFDAGAWVDYNSGLPSTTWLSPGEAAFLNAPVAKQVTLVGEVPQGDALTVALAPNYALVSSIVPQQLFLVSSNSFPAVQDMLYLTFNPDTQKYITAIFDAGAWVNYDTGLPTDVNPAVGQGFFINNPGTTAANWTRSFHVQ